MITQEKSRLKHIWLIISRRTVLMLTAVVVLLIAVTAVISASAKEISITEINEFNGTNETHKVYTFTGGSVGEFLRMRNLDLRQTDKINIPIDREITTDEQIVIMRGKEITIIADGVKRGAVVTKADAHAALVEAGYVPSEQDEISVKPSGDLASSDTIEFVTVSVTEDIKKEEIEPAIEYVDDPSLTVGETRVIDEGQSGVREIKSVTTYRSGEQFNSELLDVSVTVAPKSKVVAVGTKTPETVTALMPAGTIKVSDTGGTINGMKYSRKINMTATAYSTSPSENGGYSVSAMGGKLGFGIAAIDPRVVPLGSKVYVTSPDGTWNYGIASAEDTGGAIKGNRIDLCYEGSVSEVNMFGRRSCVVYILE